MLLYSTASYCNNVRIDVLSLLKVIDVPHPVDSPLELCYDPDWLIITKDTSSMFPNKAQHWIPPLVRDDHNKYVLPLYHVMSCD